MKKYVVVKVKVDNDRNVTSILDVLFESDDEKQAEKIGRMLSMIYPLEEDEYIANAKAYTFHKKICLN